MSKETGDFAAQTGIAILRWWNMTDQLQPETRRTERCPLLRPNAPCWIWLKAKNGGGYGEMKRGKLPRLSPHREAWQALNGPIPQGSELHHLCKNRACYNPSHLLVVTPSEHLLIDPTWTRWGLTRKVCQRGHQLAGANIRVNRYDGKRYCGECAKENWRRYYRRHRSKTQGLRCLALRHGGGGE